MQFTLTYDDIRKWMINFLELDMQVTAFNATCGQFLITTSPDGIRKLLPRGYLNYQQYFGIEETDATSVTLNIMGSNGSDEVLNGLLVKYVNRCWGGGIMERLKYGKVKIHLNQITIMRDIELQSLAFSEEGLTMEFADNPQLFEHLRMVQMFLRAGYTQVRIVPEDMEYSGYWFSDDALDYTLKTEKHPADMRMWTSFYVPDWLEVDDEYIQGLCRPSYPQEDIYYQYGSITISIPVTIAEPEINANTIERNCKRLQTEIAPLLTELLYYSPRNRLV